MRSVVAYFIKYPVGVNIAMFSLIIFGILGYLQVNSSFFPQVPSRIISISITYPGASPAEIEEGVVLKIEDNLRGLVGIDRYTSVSRENAGTITVETLEDADIDVVLQDVKNAVDRVPNYPGGMEPLVVAKQENFNEAITFTVSGDGVPLRTLKRIARDVESDLRAINGISQVELQGFPREEIEIAVREDDLRAYGLTFAEVARAVANANLLTTGGTIKTDTEEFLIRAQNRSYYGDELDFIIVRSAAGGDVVYLKDVADVNDQFEENPDRLYYNGDSGVSVTVSTTNTEDLVGASKKTQEYIEKFNAANSNVQLNITNDPSIVIQQRTELLLENGIVGVLLVLILLSLFLKPSLAFWVAVGLPISFFGFFIFAPGLITINVLSLFGLIIVIGILVDDGIVIGENIYQHYEMGKNPIQAAIDGTLEVTVPIISAITTTIIAFSTFFFLEGRVGTFFSEVSTVVIITLAVSLIEALIILPSHIAHSRSLKENAKSYKINEYADKLMFWLRDNLYSPVLRFILNFKMIGFAVPIALLLLTIGSIAGGIIRVTFFPSIASDQVRISLKMPQGTTEGITDSLLTVIEDAAWDVNAEFTERQSDNKQVIENIVRRLGPGPSQGTLTLNLLPGEERDAPAADITNAVRQATPRIYGYENLEFGSGSNFGGSPVSIALVSNNLEQLKGAKREVRQALENLAILKDVTDNDPAGIKEIRMELRESAYLLGLTLNDVMSQVRAGFFGQPVQRFQRGQDEIRVWVRYDREERSSLRNLDQMRIVTPTGQRVPLTEIATYEIERGEVAINHLDGEREIRINADLSNPKESATDVLADIQQNILPGILEKYPAVEPLFEGQNREAGKVINSARTTIPVVLFLIYCVIAFTFRSYSQPLMLFVLIPFSLIGVAWGHYIHGFPINILSWLGIIALIGILVNDGLVLIGKFNSYLKEGKDFREALYEAGRSRFRAIFLTSMTTIAGLAPLLFETSRQAQFLKPMAISISYGIGVATFLTLLLLPLLLAVSNQIKVGRTWLWTGKKPSRESVERAIREKEAEAMMER